MLYVLIIIVIIMCVWVCVCVYILVSLKHVLMFIIFFIIMSSSQNYSSFIYFYFTSPISSYIIFEGDLSHGVRDDKRWRFWNCHHKIEASFDWNSLDNIVICICLPKPLIIRNFPGLHKTTQKLYFSSNKFVFVFLKAFYFLMFHFSSFFLRPHRKRKAQNYCTYLYSFISKMTSLFD